ncbi:MAG: alpha/beta-hydrolase family protein [Actinomycetota bacterium]
MTAPSQDAIDQQPGAQAEPAGRVTGSRSPRVFSPLFSGTGVTAALAFFSLSLEPSLLPRRPLFQGVVSGISVILGYGLGVFGHWIWSYLELPKLKGHRQRMLVWIASLVMVIGFMTLPAVWRHVGWQNDVRSIFGMDPTSPWVWLAIPVVTVLLAASILIVARSIRALFRLFARWLDKVLPRRLSLVMGGTALLLLIWWVWSGLLVSGFFSVANQVFSVRDDATAEGVEQPDSPSRSGSPESLVPWETLGRQGRSVVAGGPTLAKLDAFHGGGALEPVRVYAGLKSADSLEERADLVLEELKRAGAFDREVLVVATTTGTGWLDPNAMDTLEYLFNGDTAIVGVQYSYLPSPISLLADQQAVRKTSRAIFETIHDYWSTLPEASRPRIYLFGLSLGSLGVESILSSISIINAPVNGALLAGPPFVNELRRYIVANRDEGSPPWRPIFERGRTVRFTTEENALDLPTAEWGQTRIVYLQHASDPLVFFSPDLALRRPDWLKEGQRGPEIPDKMTWTPLVTMGQLAVDIMAATAVPEGYGHLYSPSAYIDSWIGITRPDGWSEEDTARLKQLFTGG